MDTLISKYPEHRTQIREVYNFQISLKTFRQINIPTKPIGKKQTDVPILFSHFLNVIHLRFQSQIDYFILGLQNQNPETFSTARNCMETIGALIFVYDAISSKIEGGDFEGAHAVLAKASMGERNKQISFLTSEEVVDYAKKAYNVLDYIDGADKLVTKIFKVDGEEKKYFRAQYDLLCELTHPNYLAQSMLWGVEDDKFKYQQILRDEDFGLLVRLILPLLPIYLYFLKKAQKLEEQMNAKRGMK